MAGNIIFISKLYTAIVVRLPSSLWVELLVVDFLDDENNEIQNHMTSIFLSTDRYHSLPPDYHSSVHLLSTMPPTKKMMAEELHNIIEAQKKQLQDQQKVIGMS